MFKKTPNASNLLYTMLVAVLFTSCKKTTDNQTVFVEEKQTEHIIRVGGGNDVYVTEVDSCEYLIFDGYKAGGIIHKQNCKFCLARNAK
jgi:hypothetical protein